jgi:hypothetical protein
VTGYGGERPRDRRSIPGRVKNDLHVVLTSSGTHTASYPMGTGVRGGLKRQGGETDHSTPTGTEVKKM